jgi:hypothetical protein
VRIGQRLKIYDLIALTRPRNKGPQVLAMLEAYFDESGIHRGAEVCVIAGFFGYGDQWKAQEKKWRAVLADFNFPMEKFHMSKIGNSDKYKPMFEALADSIAKSSIFPVSAAIVVPDFLSFTEKERKFLTGATLNEKTGKLVTSGCQSRPYFTPFQLCLKNITDYTKPGRKSNFFFGLDRPMGKYARILFQQIKMQRDSPESDWATKRRLGDPAFPLARETPQLQAADLYAFFTYQHVLENYSTDTKWGQPSGTLKKCLRNMRSRKDHVFQNRKCLEDTLALTHSFAGDWRTR